MKRMIWGAALALMALPMLLPLWLIASGSLMGETEVWRMLGPVLSSANGFARWPMLPQFPTLRPYVALLMDSPEFFAMFWNSVLYAVVAMVGQAVLGAGVAWAFARYRFPLRRALFAGYIALMLMPFQVVLVAQYLALDRLHLIDTRLAIMLPAMCSTFPVFIMTKFFEAVPVEVLEAARVDGAGELRAFLQIGLPLGIPGLMSALVLGFLEVWGMIEQPMTLLRDPRLWPLTLYLPKIEGDEMGRALAASVVVLMPALLAFLAGQKYLVQGIGAMGVKER